MNYVSEFSCDNCGYQSRSYGCEHHDLMMHVRSESETVVESDDEGGLYGSGAIDAEKEKLDL